LFVQNQSFSTAIIYCNNVGCVRRASLRKDALLMGHEKGVLFVGRETVFYKIGGS